MAPVCATITARNTLESLETIHGMYRANSLPAEPVIKTDDELKNYRVEE